MLLPLDGFFSTFGESIHGLISFDHLKIGRAEVCDAWSVQGSQRRPAMISPVLSAPVRATMRSAGVPLWLRR